MRDVVLILERLGQQGRGSTTAVSFAASGRGSGDAPAFVMAGLDPAIHVLFSCREDQEAR
jgi:hypothetical protein